METEITPVKEAKTVTANPDGGVNATKETGEKPSPARGALNSLKSQTNDRFESGEKPAPEPAKAQEKATEAPPAKKEEPKKESKADPEKKDGTDPDIKQTAEGLVEVDGKKYFYHPQVHAEGEKTRPNSYADREATEDAAVAKIELMRERVDALKQANKSVRTLGLPAALDGTPDKLSELTEEQIIAMSDQDLRSFIREADQFDLKATSKLDRVKTRQQKEQEKIQTTEKFTKLQDVAEQTLAELKIDPQAKKYDNTDAFFADLDQSIESQVDEQLQPMVRELQDLEEDDDKLDEMGQREFLRLVKQKTLDLQERREDLKRQYAEKKQRIQEFIDTAREAQGDTGDEKESKLTDAQKARLRKESVAEFEDDMKESGRQLTEEKSRAFMSWANRHRSKYNDLVTTDDVYDAFHGHEKYKTQLRQELRAKQISGDSGSRSSDRGDFKTPDPGRQIKDDPLDRTPSKERLKGLSKELNQRFPFQ